MKKRVMCLLILLSVRLFAMQWPLGNLLPEYCFLQERLPMEWYLIPDKQPLYPIEKGEVIFLYDQPLMGGIPLYQGSILVMEHANQYRSIYESSTFSTLLKEREFLENSDRLNSDSYSHFGLSIWDSRSGSWVNPLMILPGVADKTAPQLSKAFVRNGNDEYLLGRDNILPAGEYVLLLEAWDPLAEYPEIQWLPYRLESRYMGGLLKKVEFNGALYKDGDQHLLDDASPLNKVLQTQSQRIELGSFTLGNGSSELEISIYDIQGNRTFHSFGLQVAP